MARSKLKFAVLLAVSLACPGVTMAQAPSPEVLAAAREFMVASKMADQMKQTVLLMLQQALKAPESPVAGHHHDAIAAAVTGVLSSSVDAAVNEAAQVYARHFTADEIRQMTSFYRTPAGEKLLQKSPDLARELVVALQKLSPEFRNSLTEALRSRGYLP